MKNEEKLTLAFIESSPVEAARVMEKLSVGDVAAYLEEIPARFGGLAVHPLVPDFAGQCLQ
ncbi:MAG: hypothetical protein GWM98_06645, partial [Nitrospinaceae bacterium]|nr:hypothetical protein [Nitrospinaceae bacterium]NIR54234.1 hypothetical protein [Nitrospinaceae bacterium]NIS84649.1 hypothetical protein [Nitrospinaceae bacterium]NIT81444.1 hypothetical protein [Nitrospinaceae bacterium]NIU43727.1 hypothetical protein [Nitrospinaceae bacterium]